MSSNESYVEEKYSEIKVLYDADIDEISIEPPMEEWSSLKSYSIPENPKKILYNQGLFSPGSSEICAKYIAMSASSVLRHPYYNYPAILDPGIMKALKQPELKIIYPDDGQKLYMALCEKMNQCPVRSFHRGLVQEVINLRYYGVNPNGVRAMAMALNYNNIVKVLDLTDNYLTNDACFHLGEMLVTNNCLTELNLNGCRIGYEGARIFFCNLPINRKLKVLRLNNNELGDIGTEYLSKAIFRGIEVKELYLSFNNIGKEGCKALTEAFETHNKFTVLDLSWNKLFSPSETCNLLNELSQNEKLKELYLSWNSLAGYKIGNTIKKVMAAPNLQHLDLSNNRIASDAIRRIILGLDKARSLMTLDLSYNPLLPADASKVLTKMCQSSVTVQKVLMENVLVDENFLNLLSQVKSNKSRTNIDTVVTYGSVMTKFVSVGSDFREIILNRIDYLASKPKNKVDFALLVMQLLRNGVTMMDSRKFTKAVRNAGAPVDDDLMESLAGLFLGPCTPKSRAIDLVKLNDYLQRKWPDKKLPPTPPPEPEPIPKKTKDKKKEVRKK